jgi:hypothetical protein
LVPVPQLERLPPVEPQFQRLPPVEQPQRLPPVESSRPLVPVPQRIPPVETPRTADPPRDRETDVKQWMVYVAASVWAASSIKGFFKSAAKDVIIS